MVPCLPARVSACPTYYSPAWRALPPPAERRRAAARLARAAGERARCTAAPGCSSRSRCWSRRSRVARAGPLPAPALPPAFDAATALDARARAGADPSRPLAGHGRRATARRRWVRDAVRARTGSRPRVDRFDGRHPRTGHGARSSTSSRSSPAARPQAIVVMAHRDNIGIGPGANDNASGTAALLELARTYAVLGAGEPRGARRRRRAHARLRLHRRRRARRRSAPAASPSTRPIATASSRSSTSTRSPAAARRGSSSPATRRARRRPLVETPRCACSSRPGELPAHASALRQLVDLGVPVHASTSRRRSSAAASRR